MGKINYKLLPIKAHFFFFFAGLGPVLPFLPVFGKHLGVSEVVIGGINGTIPILFLGLKPLFGYIIDYFQEKRKTIFMTLIFLMGLLYYLIGFIPEGMVTVSQEISYDHITKCNKRVQYLTLAKLHCGNYVETVFKGDDGICYQNPLKNYTFDGNCTAEYLDQKPGFYSGFSFWAFVLLMSLGTILFNISNSISDAICFDVLGEGNDILFGKQRVWGTIGFGIFALFGGYLMSKMSGGGFNSMKDSLPAVHICIICILIDLACCKKLNLPPLPKSENIIMDTWKLVKQPHIATFLVFAVMVGVCDSTIIYYLLWYLEDLAKETLQSENIELLQGLVVAAETLVGEVISFYFSDKVLTKLGYGNCLTVCLFFYFLRLSSIALIPSPWWVLPIEVVMQGPTYAICYSTIVAYASAVAPPGTSATVQGIVAGMDDGFGFALGCTIGSVIYRFYGGRVLFASAGILALFCGISHCILYQVYFKNSVQVSIRKADASGIQVSDIIDPESTIPLKLKNTQ